MFESPYIPDEPDPGRDRAEYEQSEAALAALAKRYKSWPEWLEMHKPTVTARLKRLNPLRMPGQRIAGWRPKLTKKAIFALIEVPMTTREMRETKARRLAR